MAVQSAGAEREPPVMTTLDLRLLPERAKYFVALTVPPVMVTEEETAPDSLLL